MIWNKIIKEKNPKWNFRIKLKEKIQLLLEKEDVF